MADTGGMHENRPEINAAAPGPEAIAQPYAQQPYPPQPQSPWIAGQERGTDAKSSKRVRPVRDAWLLVGIGVLVPMLALVGGIWATIQAANGEKRAIPIAIVGISVFFLRMALYFNS